MIEAIRQAVGKLVFWIIELGAKKTLTDMWSIFESMRQNMNMCQKMLNINGALFIQIHSPEHIR